MVSAPSSTPLSASDSRQEASGTSETELRLGVDIGGTNIKVGIGDHEGRIVRRDSFPTASAKTARDAFERVRRIADGWCREMELPAESFDSVGVAVAGILDSRAGVLREVSNLPHWSGVAIREELLRLFPGHVVVANDANAAAFAEYAARGLNDETLALVTLGTGVGCGIVLNGQPLAGDRGCGGEIGHTVIDTSEYARQCGCGRRGHLEAYAGAAGVVATAKWELARHSDQELSQRIANDELTPEFIAARAEDGEPHCLQVVDRTAMSLGIGISTLCQTLDPTVVLLGGAMNFGGRDSQTGRRFLSRVVEAIQSNTLDQIGRHIDVQFAELGGDAGLIGAARLIHAALSSK